ncbi:geranylgeranyl transferase type-1 subunit beta [Teleopsis dalmanni]|uniref:geranylgeranyl transferase type-1 subunit beta n=1 Tax=Teleopsis dalmanni TaxID=139649 RepID=UPI000D329C13|nr:geranylgeranyl transferase type-1 subunit beta [Teleopsis dalmanni]
MSHNTLNIEERKEPVLFTKHAKYFIRFLNVLPARLASHDCTRPTIAFYSVCGLDVLNSLHLLTPQMRKDIIEWIYTGLVEPYENEPCRGGFQGSRVKINSDDKQLLDSIRCYQWGHLAMTYTSICVLITLGDDLSRLNRQSIVDGVATNQRSDGSFSACINGCESDMRFVYCAAAICHLLDYWGNVDKDKMYSFIKDSIRYDYGVSQSGEGESHGGTTFCAIAALHLSGQLGRLDEKTLEGIKRWCLFRQIDGFQGRPNKPVDTCYSFWIGATLRILNAFTLTDYIENRKYILETQDTIVGGFSKWAQSSTDPFHTYFGICGLSFLEEPGLATVMPSLNIAMPAYKRLQQLHAQWRTNSTDDKYFNSTKEHESDTDTITSPLIKA